MAYTPLKLNTGMAASPGFGDVYRNFSGQSGNNDSAADWTGRLANEAKRKSMGAGIFANNSAAWDAYNSGNVQGFQDALGTPQDTYDPMYRSTHTPEDAARDTAGMAQFDAWAANQKAQGLQTNGGIGGYSENWSAGFGGPKFSGVAGGPSTLPQDGVKKPLAASQPVQPPAAQTAQALPPANVSNLPMSGGNTIASGPSLLTGMASQAPQTQLPQAQPIAQTASVAAPSSNIPNWWSQGATQINPLDQTFGADGMPSSNGMFGVNNYNTMLQGFIGDKWTGGSPDDSSQGYFKAQDVQDWLDQTGNKLMTNQGVGIGGGTDTYQNMHWIQDANGNIVGDPSFNRDDPNGVLKMAALAAAGYFGGSALAGAGEAAATGYAPAMNAATADSAVGTAGYGASSAGAGGGATASWGAGAGYTADALAPELADPSMWQAADQFAPDLSPLNPGTADLTLTPQESLVQNSSLGTTTPAASASASAASNPLASVTDFFKQNPQLAAALISGGLGAGGGGNPPAPPTYSGVGSGVNTGTGAAGTGTGANSQLASALRYSAGDPSQFYQDASDAAYRNQTRYLDPQVAQQQKALEARLAEQGFVPGTPGYNQAMQNFMDTNARAYAQARDTSTLQGYQVGSQNFGNSLSNAQLNNNTSNMALDQLIRSRMMPINERNAIMTGDQIQYNNQLDQYNARQETRNSNNALLGQLATALGMYYSDARLKDDIIPLGQTPGGLGIYSYTIFGRREIGVIAQEVAAKQPHAVAVDPDSGFLMVDYGRIA